MKALDSTLILSLQDEARLVERAVSGDPEAFARLYDAYMDRVYRFMLLRVSDSQTAEDLASQVFLKAWEHLDRYEIRGLSFAAWLFKIARNLVIDHYRTKKEAASLDADDAAEPVSLRTVHGDIEQQLQAEELRSALNRLTEEQKAAVTLKYIEGFTTEEIAQVMGKREGAVRALQMRGLQALAEIIEAENA